MAKRPTYQRPLKDMKRGRVSPWPADGPVRRDVAEQVSYRGNGKHKSYPSPTGEWIPSWHADAAKCDPFGHTHWPQLQALLRRAIMSGPVSEFRGKFPAR